MSGATTPTSFVRRALTVVITLGQGQFGESGTDTVTLQGLRCSAAIVKASADFQGELDLRIYGVTDSVMRQCSQMFKLDPNAVVHNDTVTVLAGDAVSGMSVAYAGTLVNAFTDYSDAPGVSFHISGIGAAADALKPVPPSSYRGAADVVTIMGNLARTMGKTLEATGVAGRVLNNPYFPGTALEQFERCKAAARIDGTVDGDTLAIWPLGGARGGAIPLISPSSGMVGYPMRTQIGVQFQCIYNPAIIIGGKVQVQTSNTPAAGTWGVNRLAHTLESETPGGQWFTAVECQTIL